MHLKIKLLGTIYLFLTVTTTPTTISAERWSRQLSSNTNSPKLLDDWIPVGTNHQQFAVQLPQAEQLVQHLPSQQQVEQQQQQELEQELLQQQPDRSDNARALSYPQNVFTASTNNNNQKNALQQSPQFNFVHPFQFQRYQQQQQQNGGGQPHQQHQQQQPPTSQSFFKFEMPSYSLDGTRNNAPSVQTGYQIQHSFGPALPQPQSVLTSSPLFNNPKQIFSSPEFHSIQQNQQPHQLPLVSSSHHRKPIQQQTFLEEPKSHLQSHVKDLKTTQAQNNLVTQRPDIFQSSPPHHTYQVQKPTSFQASQFPAFNRPSQQQQQHNLQAQQLQSSPLSQDDEIQLLYVPYDTLYPQRNEQQQQQQQQQQQLQFNSPKYNLVQPAVNPVQINNFYTQDPLDNPISNYYTIPTTSTTYRPETSSLKSTTNYQQFLNPKFTTTKPTSKPKPKPHQPPLAMFYQKGNARTSPHDVVNALSSTKSIAVLDAPSKSAPEVFVGPAGLITPPGYTKFELPYLSSFDHNNLENNLKETPFFVAPLSYKTPSGFQKILLPEPHVGSIVINKPFPNEDYNVIRGTTRRPNSNHHPIKDMYITPLQNENYNRIPNTTPKHTTLTRLQTPTSPAQRWQDQTRSTEPPPNDFYRPIYQEAIKEVTSPRTQHKQQHHHHHHHQQKRPEQTFTQTVKPYAQFKPMPSNIANDEYFKVQPSVSTDYSIDSSTTPSTTIATSPKSYFSETYPTNSEQPSTRPQFYDIQSVRPSPRPEVTRGQYVDVSSTRPSPRPEIQTTHEEVFEVSSQRPSTKPESTRSQYYDVSSTKQPKLETTRQQNSDFSSTRSSSPRPEVVQHRYQSKPLFDDEKRMKTYFRQQDVFKNRPTTPSTTLHANIQYTPVSLDYENPSSTAAYVEGSTLRTTTPKFTFYHPTAQSYETDVQENALPNEQNTEFQVETQTPEPEITIKPTSERHRPVYDTRVPANHKPTYDNEITIYNHDDTSQDIQFDPNPYDLPSELPPLTPNLPGLVNALKENERLNAIEKETTESLYTTTSSTTLRPTRRPISNRGRRPTARTSTSSSVSYSSSDDVTTKRPNNRPRRPYNPKSSTTSTVTSDGNSTTRTTAARNPNRVRYNPTPEERKQFRTRTRGSIAPKKYKQKTEEDNIDYQRDVLKQNYPVFKHPTRKSLFTTTEKTDDNIVTVTPNSIKDSFPGLLEPMQIAQQYQQQVQDNYGPGYFPNEEEINPTEPIRNEIYTTTLAPTTTLSTTIEPVKEVTKRPSLFRRARPRTSTTTEPPTTTDSTNDERYTIRPRIRPEGSLPRKVIKIRSRTRKPHPASTTEAETSTKENSYQKVSRFNKDFYNDDYKNEARKRTQVRSKFNLETQESQWSPSLTRSDSFKPLGSNDGSDLLNFQDEPEIVTALPENESRKNAETYEFNVSADLSPKANNHNGSVSKSDSSKTSPPDSRLDRKTEPTFEELLEQVMSDIGREAKKVEKIPNKNEPTTKQLKSTNIEEKPATHTRRGVWKKVRVQPSDSFETAESQNYGSHIRNQIRTNDKSTEEKTSSTLSTDEKVQIDEEQIPVLTTMLPVLEPEITTLSENIVPETESPLVPPTIPTKFETITSISEEISYSHPAVTTQATPQSKDVIITSTPAPTKGMDSTTTRFYNQDYEEDDTIGETITRRIDEERQEEDDQQNFDDLETQPSLFDEVRSQLKDLFAVEPEDDEDLDMVKQNYHPRKHEYTTIQRIRAVTEQPSSVGTEIPTTTTIINKDDNNTSFHNNLMKNVVFATATSTEVSQETEICYRGRCIKSKKPN